MVKDSKRKQEASQHLRGGEDQMKGGMGDEEMEDLSSSGAVSTTQPPSCGGGGGPISDLAVFLLEDKVW